MLQGVINAARKRHLCDTPNFLQGVTKAPRTAPSALRLKGAMHNPQKCHFDSAPTSFIWCQLRIAAMPIEQRTKGRVIFGTQKYHEHLALPTQFNGVIVKTQKCLDLVAQGERSIFHRSNATTKTPLPTSLAGAITTSQKCYKLNAPREGPSMWRRNAIRATPFPINHRGLCDTRRDAREVSPPPNLGRPRLAEMPLIGRPITRGHP
jgi:hypothetical protein